MLFHFVGAILLSLHAAEPLGKSQSPQTLTPMEASPGETVTVNCTFPEGIPLLWSSWYREEQDRSLQKINRGRSKYSKPGAKLVDPVNLDIHPAQRNDSGVYYCAAIIGRKVTILSRTRLIVSDAASPALSVFLPSFVETSQPNRSLPLLCLLFDAPPPRDALSWEIGGETSQEDPKGVSTIDGEGAPSTWSLKLIPPERWKPGISYTCSDREKRNATAVFPTNPTSRGNCIPILYAGVPCIVVLLLAPLLVLLFRKRLLGEPKAVHTGVKTRIGKLKKPATEMPPGQIQQTEYAELHCNR